MIGHLLCRLGHHDRRSVTWRETTTLVRGNGLPPKSTTFTVAGFRCVRCEPTEDVTNDPIFTPAASAELQARREHGHERG